MNEATAVAVAAAVATATTMGYAFVGGPLCTFAAAWIGAALRRMLATLLLLLQLPLRQRGVTAKEAEAAFFWVFGGADGQEMVKKRRPFDGPPHYVVKAAKKTQ